MIDEKQDFADALEGFVKAEIAQNGHSGDYISGAVEIIDARNHLFRKVEGQVTDEERGLYALRELCRVDEDTLSTVPDRMKFFAIARAYF